MNYSGIDLHSNNSVVTVTDETDRVVAEKRLPNDLVERSINTITIMRHPGLISTQPESISPFEYGGKVRLLKLPAKASVAEIFQKHAAAVADFRASHPQATPMRVHDLAGVEARWVAGQQAKAAYRKSIGYVSDAELKKLLGVHYDRFAEKVKAQIRAMSA